MIWEEISGPDFLVRYILLLGLALLFAVVLRGMARGPKWHSAAEESQLDPYEAAYLQHGPQRAVDAAVAALVHVGAFSAKGQLVTVEADLADDQIPFEDAVHKAVSREAMATTNVIRSRVRAPLRQLRGRLRQRGMVVGPIGEFALRGAPVLALLALAGFGMMRIALGISRERPVGYLIALVILTLIVALPVGLFLWGKAPIKTQKGEAALKALKRENAALGLEANSRPADLSGRDLAWVIGLFGVGSVEDATIKKLLVPPPSPSYTGGSSWSSCGGFTSCGGGGGCGGGGCGGGGCGG